LRIRTIIGWVLAVILVLAFLASAAGKLTGAATQMFARWGYPGWFATLIGVLECVGAVGLLIPGVTRYAILGLTVILLGATYTHLANHEGIQVLRPVIFLAVLWIVWWLRVAPRNATAAS
jgi:putative oxidoreductase